MHFDAALISPLIPPPHTGYAEVVAAALERFVLRLPDSRRQEILAAQASIPTGAPTPQRLVAVFRCCPTLHKLGQVLARDRRLSAPLRTELQLLESLPPRPLDPEVASQIETELGGAFGRFDLGPELLAEGSAALVLPGTRGARREAIVIKLLKSGIEQRIDEELAIWPEVGELIEEVSARVGLPAPDFESTVQRVQELLLREIALGSEQQQTTAALELFDRDRVVVPRILEESTPRMTVMTRLWGRPVTGVREPGARRELASELFVALLSRPLLQPQGPAMFHGDPHAGNLLALDDGRVGILDWSLSGLLSKHDRILLTRLLAAGLTLDARRALRTITDLADAVADRRCLRTEVRASLRRLRRFEIRPGIRWIVDLMDRCVTTKSVRFSSDLLLWRKSWLTLESVLLDVDETFDPERALLRLLGVRALKDWPRRWLSQPFDRGFGIHLSNFEIARLATSGPRTAFNYWLQTAGDVLADRTRKTSG